MVRTPRPIANAGTGPERRDVQAAQDEGHDQRDLERREEAEAKAVAEHDLGPADRRRKQAFERAADAFPQEADAGQDEDEEVGEETDHHRRERVELGGVGRAVDGRPFDRGQRGAGGVGQRLPAGPSGRSVWPKPRRRR